MRNTHWKYITGALTGLTLAEENAWAQKAITVAQVDSEARVFSASQNYTVNFVKDPIQPYFVVSAFFCTAHNTPAERRLLESALDFWNRQSGRFAYQVKTASGEKILCPVFFELTEAPGYYNASGFFMPAGQIDPFSLIYLEVLPDERMQVLNRGSEGAHAVGYTGPQAIFISEAYSDQESIGIHEMGHVLGAFHVDHSVMDPNLLFVIPKVKKKTIQHILGEAGIPLKGKPMKGTSKANLFSRTIAKRKIVKYHDSVSPSLWVFNR